MSLDSVLLLMEVEQFFDIKIPQAVAEKIYTVGDMTNAVAGVLHITEEGPGEKDHLLHPERYKADIRPAGIRTRYEIYVAVVGITCKFTGLPCREISAGSSFADDLGID